MSTAPTLAPSRCETAGNNGSQQAPPSDGNAIAATAKPRRPRKPPQRRGPRIKPIVHGEDPRFDARAACGLAASGLFDERDKGEPLHEYRMRVERAKAVCRGCPVQGGCLDFGVNNKLRGFYGGAELDQGRVLEPDRKQRR